jgi:hypothetical protein
VGKRKLQLIAAQRGYRPQLSNEIEYSQRAILEHAQRKCKDEEIAMVDIADANQAGQKAAGIECPLCRKPVTKGASVWERPDRYGRQLRNCYVWCLGCGCGFHIVQFMADDGRWRDHKYIRYVRGQRGSAGPCSDWVVVAELPEPAPVVVGPGGEFDEGYDLVTPIT